MPPPPPIPPPPQIAPPGHPPHLDSGMWKIFDICEKRPFQKCMDPSVRCLAKGSRICRNLATVSSNLKPMVSRVLLMFHGLYQPDWMSQSSFRHQGGGDPLLISNPAYSHTYSAFVQTPLSCKSDFPVFPYNLPFLCSADFQGVFHKQQKSRFFRTVPWWIAFNVFQIFPWCAPHCPCRVAAATLVLGQGPHAMAGILPLEYDAAPRWSEGLGTLTLGSGREHHIRALGTGYSGQWKGDVLFCFVVW